MTVTPFNPTLDAALPLEVGSQVWTTSDEPPSTSEPPLSPTRSAAPVPVGLSSKELARLRSAAILPPPAHARTSPSGFQHIPPPTSSASEGSTLSPAPDTTRRLQTAVESLQREIQELRAERLEAPPSYGDGGGV